MGYEWRGIKAKRSFLSSGHDSLVCFLSSHNPKTSKEKGKPTASGLPFLHGVKLVICHIKPLQISNKKMKGLWWLCILLPIDRFGILYIELLTKALAPFVSYMPQRSAGSIPRIRKWFIVIYFWFPWTFFSNL